MDERGKSDRPVVPAKPPNKRRASGRGGGGGKGTGQGERGRQNASRTQSRARRVKCAGSCAPRWHRKDKDARFTALLHHVDVDRLRAAYRALRPKAAPGVDGVTWEAYGQDLEAQPPGPARAGASRALSGEAVAEGVHPQGGRAAAAARDRRAGGQDRPAGRRRGAQRASMRWTSSVSPTGSGRDAARIDALDALAAGIDAQEGELGARRGHPRVLHQPGPVVAGEVSRAPDRGQAGPAADPEMAERRGDRGRVVVGERRRARRREHRLRRCWRTSTCTTSLTCGPSDGDAVTRTGT